MKRYSHSKSEYQSRFAYFTAAILVILQFASLTAFTQDNRYQNPAEIIDARLNDLLGKLSLEEKVSLLGYNSPSITRLGINSYSWWNEALHGVARAGNATVFPQAIAMAASFDDALLESCASAISTEARAKYNLSTQRGSRLQYMGLTFWSPNINIFRDPRWGRGQETYGEDPYLTARMGTAFVHGMQGRDTLHLKTAACAKHFAVHSGPESERHGFNAIVGEKDLRETYLYAFRQLVNAGVESVMCAYNRTNNEPCCTGNTLLQTILRKEWGFKGQVVTDCWALQDIYTQHKTLPNSIAVAAAAVKAGVNVDCSNLLQADVMNAVKQKLLTESDVNSAVAGSLRTQLKLGMFDNPNSSPYSKYDEDSVANDYHRSLARVMAQRSMVLLKNDNKLLPLDRGKYKAYMMVGPNAGSTDALLANYHGVSNKTVNFVEGLVNAVGSGVRVEYDMGCDNSDTVRFGGIWAASNADITIAVLGLTAVYEGEEGDAFLAAGGGDRKTLSLPRSHLAYLRALRKGTKTPIVLVITAGSAVDISEVAPYADAIIMAWYPGEEGGNALADILFGKVSPSGRLPVTFYKSLSDLPPYNDYSMNGRTYRYFDREVQFPFGFGLSYADFKYDWTSQPAINNDRIEFSVMVTNLSQMDAAEVAQVYLKCPSGKDIPIRELKAFQRVLIPGHLQAKMLFSIPIEELNKWDASRHAWTIADGTYTIIVGRNAKDTQLEATINWKGKKK